LLRKLAKNDPLTDAVLKGDFAAYAFEQVDLAILQFAEVASTHAAALHDSELNRLREAGLSDQQILDASLVVGYFAWANRFQHALEAFGLD
jgi:alkylhydroperoxidase family enzyme